MPRLLAAVRAAVRCWLEGIDWASDRVEGIVLAVDEACANAIRHSYGGRCDEMVSVMLQSSPGGLEVSVCDSGTPCPPGRVQRRSLEPPSIDDLTPGGLGVQLMYEVFDEVVFERQGESGNRVTLRLNRRPKDGR